LNVFAWLDGDRTGASEALAACAAAAASLSLFVLDEKKQFHYKKKGRFVNIESQPETLLYVYTKNNCIPSPFP